MVQDGGALCIATAASAPCRLRYECRRKGWEPPLRIADAQPCPPTRHTYGRPVTITAVTVTIPERMSSPSFSAVAEPHREVASTRLRWSRRWKPLENYRAA